MVAAPASRSTRFRGAAGRAFLFGLVALSALVGAGAGSASSNYPNDPNTAQPWVSECDGADLACLAIVERLESISYNVWANHDLHIQDRSSGTEVRPAPNEVFPVSGPLTDAELRASAVPISGGSGGGAVSLDAAAKDRLDLIWWGVWAGIGLMFVGLMAPRWASAFRTDRV